jgi:hypothetical protein
MKLSLFRCPPIQPCLAIFDEAACLVILGLEPLSVDRRVEGFSLPTDHGFTLHAIGVFRFLNIPFAQKHGGGGLIGEGSREPFGQRDQLIGDPVRVAELANASLPRQRAGAGVHHHPSDGGNSGMIEAELGGIGLDRGDDAIRPCFGWGILRRQPG